MVTEKELLSSFGISITAWHLDIFLSSLSFERLSKGAKWFDIGDAKVRVASKELLIQIKNEITPLRPKDVLDVQELSRLTEEESR